MATAAVAALALLAGLLATTTVASNVARIARFDDAVGALRSASFDLGALSALGVQPLLGADYVTSVVGDAFEPAAVRTPVAVGAAPPAKPDEAGSTTTTTTRRNLVGRLLTGEARFSARMLADRQTVAPGEEITYTVVLTNTGTSTIRGTIEVQSHVPIGTIDARRQCDSELGVDVDPDHLCASAAAPGAGEQTHQIVLSSSGRLEPGEERTVSFSVRVADVVPPDTEITNHAHADLVGDGSEAVTTDPVVVVVVS